ncbi:MAG TPA: sensor domain-containing diguanylate cyclase [Longimicrobiales bacterium]
MEQHIEPADAGHRIPLTLALWAASVGAVLFYLAPTDNDIRTIFVAAFLILAPLAAFAACVGAARVVSRAVAWPWIALALAAGMSAGGQMHWHDVGQPVESWHALVDVAAFSLVAIGLGGILHQREHERFDEIALDMALILVAGAVVTLRWSPAARAILNGAGQWPLAEAIAAFAVPIAAGCAILFGNVLLIVRGTTPAGPAAAAISAATAGLGLAAVPLTFGNGACCAASDAAGLAFVLAWFAFAYAGLRVQGIGTQAFLPLARDGAGGRLRMIVAPAVAVVMGFVIIDSAWSNLHGVTAIGLAAVGLLLALRVSQLLRATRSQSAERAELAQSRAMIEVSQALAGTTRLDETLDLITQHAVRLLRGRAATIELLTGDGRHLEFYAVHGLPRDVLHMRFPVDGSFTGWVVAHGRARAAVDPHTDPYIDVDGLPYIDRSPVAAAPLRYRDATLGALSCIGRYPFDDADLELLTALADQAAVAIENVRLFQQVHQMSLTDPLTGLPNRRQLERDLAREFSAAERGRPLAAIMFDLNEFKEYNDRYGHVAGDDALRLFGRALTAETRAMNMAARYGGDEFIALLTDADEEGAETFIARVRSAFPGPDAAGPQRLLGFSAGYAVYDPSMATPEALVAAADRALYNSKSVRPV